MKGIELIQQERERQIKKGWSLEHDKRHKYGDLRVQAATICCDGTDAEVVDLLGRGTPCFNNDIEEFEGDSWGILERWHKKEPNDQKREVRLLSIAGALIAAEIDRILETDNERD